MPRTRSARFALLVLVLAAPLGACAGDPLPVATEPETATPTPTPSAVPASVVCLESGAWVVDAAHESAKETAAMHTVGGSDGATYSGEAVYAFDGGVLTRQFAAWRLDFSLAAEIVLTVGQSLSGTTTAPYMVTADTITAAAADVSALSVEYAGTANGMPLDPAENQERIAQGEAAPAAWAYTCAGGVLTLQATTADGVIADGTTILTAR